jgi:hypothetical protein
MLTSFNSLKKASQLLLVYVLLILGCESVPLSAKVIYISSSTGNDNNDGQTPSTPMKTIAKAAAKGDTLLLKAGDIFYGRTDFINKTVTRYGKGNNPVISGFKGIGNAKWQIVEPNIWVLDLTSSGYSGVITKGSSELNNIGCFHQIDEDVIHGYKVQYKSELKKDWDFWQTEKFKDAKAVDFDRVYLYYKGNPNNLSLEVSTGSSGAMVQNSDLSFINFIGFGKHGIAAKDKSRIHDCKIDMIGGMTFVGYNTYCSLGNGIEFYVNQDISDSEVYGCYVKRCYDSGITIQAAGMGRCTPRNIRIHDNLIVNCCQAWEDFLCNDSDVVFVNCRFENNIIAYSGDSGFGYPKGRFKYCNILGGNAEGIRGMIIKENVFYGGNLYCSSSNGGYKSNSWIGNKHYVLRGSYVLSNYMGTNDVIRIPENGSPEPTIKLYRDLTGDYSTKFKVRSEDSIKRMSIKAIKKFLNKHTY